MSEQKLEPLSGLRLQSILAGALPPTGQDVRAMIEEIARLRAERPGWREALGLARKPLRAIAMNGRKYGPLYSHAIQALHAIEATLHPSVAEGRGSDNRPPAKSGPA